MNQSPCRWPKTVVLCLAVTRLRALLLFLHRLDVDQHSRKLFWHPYTWVLHTQHLILLSFGSACHWIMTHIPTWLTNADASTATYRKVKWL